MKWFLFILIIFCSSCSGGNVDTVRDGVFEFDKTRTVGDAFETYPFFKKGEWYEESDEKKRQFVVYRAEYDMDFLIKKIVEIPENLRRNNSLHLLNISALLEPYFSELYSKGGPVNTIKRTAYFYFIINKDDGIFNFSHVKIVDENDNEESSAYSGFLTEVYRGSKPVDSGDIEDAVEGYLQRVRYEVNKSDILGNTLCSGRVYARKYIERQNGSIAALEDSSSICDVQADINITDFDKNTVDLVITIWPDINSNVNSDSKMSFCKILFNGKNVKIEKSLKYPQENDALLRYYETNFDSRYDLADDQYIDFNTQISSSKEDEIGIKLLKLHHLDVLGKIISLELSPVKVLQ